MSNTFSKINNITGLAFLNVCVYIRWETRENIRFNTPGYCSICHIELLSVAM